MINIMKVAALVAGLSFPAPEKGMATYYSYRDFGNGPLYASSHLRYDVHNGVSWCAVNVSAFENGSVLPGDLLLVHFIDSDDLLFLEAWDAGPFDGFFIEEHPDLPILVDIPQHLWPSSARSAEIELINLTAAKRVLQ